MTEEKGLNFIEDIVEEDLKNGKYNRIVTRFPPEPNGYLHIGHASSICLNFGLTEKYGGYTNLRFDDTNPVTEETVYVDSIKEDVKWLGFEWKHELYASDYFGTLYQFAIDLIKKELAYVDDSSSDEIAALKGTPTEPGKNSPYRNRAVEENLDLFEGMKKGEFKDGSKTLRAKINMAHSNMLMRDPVLYRIKHAHHHRTGNNWCIYPMYDFAHGQSDSIEEVTHSLCTLEFVPHRELYDWLIEKLEIFPSKQYEFARRNLTYTITSKRKLLQLVNENHVEGWDDPRMTTISGMRRRGFTPESIRDFCTRIGVAKRENLVDMSLLEHCVREHLNKIAIRRMAVLDPVKLIITNYPAGQTEEVFSENNPEAENNGGTRPVAFSGELWIEREDFMETPAKKWFRLAPGAMVRLKSAYIVKCEDCVKDNEGNITAIHCTYIPESKSGNDVSGVRAKGTIHWVSAAHAAEAEVRLYDRLFTTENPGEEEDFTSYINPNSFQIVKKTYIESSLRDAAEGEKFQFIRKGYFTPDKLSSPGHLIFNRTATLKDTWAKESKKEQV
ncbi:glutamine--tRNA ligase/YqeY domain fusion protein [Agriterribacter sp.]|uniref:glutamine--tRNA ligase/YqeY domain fusion protein n=1 Tax=Agriterribacter sp. TaxID=2821509 RepID=UPI002B557D1B|nr:glutamine--tRNA ligase/YqeY domain fusion protein [Agriterribacter sp.]HRP55397.1 glutamine--tRNA ligase/YqeY domain fusion protein [Agriterribacter sp.]